MKLETRVRREKLGFTQQEIGDKLGLSAATISYIESGQHSYYKKDYEKLLAELEEKRLYELIQVYPRQAGRYLGELASTRGNGEESSNLGLQAA
jgi:transcriptional regulator with XRE-family HTH domain